MSSLHASVCGHLGCSYILDIMKNAAMSTHALVLCARMFSFALGVYPAVELLGHMLTQCQTVSAKKLHHFNSPPATYKASDFSTSSTTLVIIGFFDYSPYSFLPTLLHSAWNMACSHIFNEQIMNDSRITACLQFSCVYYECIYYD